MARLGNLPLLLLLAAVGSAAMVAPAALALAQKEFHDARSFFYAALIGLTLTAMIAIAVAGRPHQKNPIRQLVALLAAFVLLPALFAVPFLEAVRTTTFLNAYVEMASSFTTTGATLFAPDRLSEPEHLWRAIVGWMGGGLIWVAAAAILAPLTLGGFEVTAVSEPGQTPAPGAAHRDQADPAQRLSRAVEALVPVYLGLTGAVWLLLLMAGDRPFVALCHAMATLSTSGISPLGGLSHTDSGIAGEMVIFAFLFFALSRLTFSSDTSAARRTGLWYDPEFRLGCLLTVFVPTLLFLRHWVASFDVGDEENFAAALRSLWGGVFTTLSFLTTTGFESAEWERTQNWSAVETPGLILMGLAILGGGVATTAGGVKLLRVFILYLNGRRELERLIHPSSVGRSGLLTRRVRREGAFIAWVFFMMFAITLTLTVLAFALTGIRFEPSFVLAIAALTNAGPLLVSAIDTPIALAQSAASTKLVFAAAAVLGRFEVLALVVMLTPDPWRD